MKRKRTKKILVGDVAIGGGSPVSVQSMTNTDTRDIPATIRQIRRLERAGCQIVRVAVPDSEAATAMRSIVERSNVPIIADVHFNYRLALMSIEAGVHCIRINPGNIGGRKRVAAVVNRAGERGVPLRIGVNAGSLEKDILKKHGKPNAAALTESMMRNVKLIESMHFNNMKLSVKSSDVMTSIEAYRSIAKKLPYPLHLGVTEAGTAFSGSIKSAVGIGVLLEQGIGDTIRVSLSADPVKEVRAAYEILRCLGLRRYGVEIVACPTCGRKQMDVEKMAAYIEKKVSRITKPIKVAIMGCEVNGPGEGKEADIGIAGGKKYGVLFKKGAILKKCDPSQLVSELLKEIDNIQV